MPTINDRLAVKLGYEVISWPAINRGLSQLELAPVHAHNLEDHFKKKRLFINPATHGVKWTTSRYVAIEECRTALRACGVPASVEQIEDAYQQWQANLPSRNANG